MQVLIGLDKPPILIVAMMKELLAEGQERG
jgi:hypothetical protein